MRKTLSAGVALGAAVAFAAFAPASAATSDTADLAVLHAIPDTPVDVYVNGDLTIEANEDIAQFHDRQMAVVRREQRMAWLDRTCREDQLLRPLPAGSFRISRLRDEPRQAELTF